MTRRYNSIPVGYRWYRQVPFLLLIGSLLFQWSFDFVTYYWFKFRAFTIPIVPVIASTGFITAILWLTYLTPFLSASDRLVLWKKPPSKIRRELMGSLWAPPLGIAATGLIILLVGIGFAIHHDDPIESEMLQASGIILVTGVAMSLISWRIWRAAEPRFQENVQDRVVCFDCGYDLRGIPESTTCPECGWAIAWVKPGDPADG